MSITVTIAKSVSEHDYAQVETLVRHLQGTDHNFTGRAIWVERGRVTTVRDSGDALRGALLATLVHAVLRRR